MTSFDSRDDSFSDLLSTLSVSIALFSMVLAPQPIS